MEQMDKQQVLHSLSMTDCIRLMRTVLRSMPREKANSISAQSPACRETTCLGLCLRIWEQATISALRSSPFFPVTIR